MPSARLAPDDELRIKADGNIVHEKSLINARDIDLLGRAGERCIQRFAPAERHFQIAGEVVVRAERDHTEECFAVDEGLDDGVDRSVSPGSNEESSALAHLAADDVRHLDVPRDAKNVEAGLLLRRFQTRETGP